MSPCPTEDVLQSYCEQRLSGLDERAVNEHVSTCSACRVVVAELARQSGGVDEPSSDRFFRRGTLVGRYVILELVGAGGMGVVYGAYDTQLERRVALKVLRRAEGQEDRLVQEARAMARLNHPNVAALYGVENVGGVLLVTMEFIAGQTLRAWAEERPRSLDELLDVFVQAGRGLQAAHAAGLVHRDFKPDNVMIRSDGRVSVLDFGLARAVGNEVPVPSGVVSAATPHTQSGTVLGTARYMAPEQRLGHRVDARADQHAFCVSLHELIFGAPPGETVRREISVPSRLRAAIERGLSERPDDRFPDFASLVGVLESLRRRSSRRSFAIAGALVLIGGAAIVASQRDPCASGAAELESAWAPGVRVVLERALIEKAAPNAVAQALSRLDDYAAEWLVEHRSACEATRKKGTQSEELLDRRMLCLSNRKISLETVVSTLTNAPSASPMPAVTSLPRVSDCSDTANLLGAVPPPSDPADRARLAALRKRIEEARTLQNLNRSDEARGVADAALKDAESMDYAPVVTEALLVRGPILRRHGNFEGYLETGWLAVASAKAARDGQLEAKAWLIVADSLRLLNRYPEAERIYALSKAANEALAEHDALEASRLASQGMALEAALDLPRAREALRQSIALHEKISKAPSDEVAHILSALAGVELAAHDLVAAETLARRALAIARADQSGESDVPFFLVSLAEVLEEAGRFDEARGILEEALVIRKASGERFAIIHVVDELADLEALAGDFRRAIAYRQEVLALVEQMPAPDLVAEAVGGLGLHRLDNGEPEEGLALLTRALRFFEFAGLAGDPRVLAPRLAMTRAMIESGQPEQGRRELERFAAEIEKPPNDAVKGAVWIEAGRAFWSLGERARGRALVEQGRDASVGGLRILADRWLAAHQR